MILAGKQQYDPAAHVITGEDAASVVEHTRDEGGHELGSGPGAARKLAGTRRREGDPQRSGSAPLASWQARSHRSLSEYHCAIPAILLSLVASPAGSSALKA